MAVSTLRAELSEWIARVRNGEEVVITDRGTPVARLTAVEASPLLERLTAEGVIAKPRRARRPKATGARRITSSESVSDLIADQRR